MSVFTFTSAGINFPVFFLSRFLNSEVTFAGFPISGNNFDSMELCKMATGLSIPLSPSPPHSRPQDQVNKPWGVTGFYFQQPPHLTCFRSLFPLLLSNFTPSQRFYLPSTRPDSRYLFNFTTISVFIDIIPPASVCKNLYLTFVSLFHFIYP